MVRWMTTAACTGLGGAVVACTPPAAPEPPVVIACDTPLDWIAPEAPSAPTGDEAEGWTWFRGAPLTLGGDRKRCTAHAIGPAGVFHLWTTAGWTDLPVPTPHSLTSAWVVDPTRMWVTDDHGRLWQRVKGEWAMAPVDFWAHRLLGLEDGSLYAIAADETPGASGPQLMKHVSGTWEQAATMFDEFCYGGDFTVMPDGEVWATGLICDDEGRVTGNRVYAYDGRDWRPIGDRIINKSAWNSSFLDTAAAVRIRAGGTYEWNGAAWLPVDLPSYPQDLSPELEAVPDGLGYTAVPRTLSCTAGYRVDDATVFCTGEGQLYTLDEPDGGWDRLAPVPASRPDAEWGQVPPMLWAGGDAVLAWGTGPQGSVFRSPDDTRTLERYADGSWEEVLDTTVVDLHGATDDDVWVTTPDGPMHFDGHEWTLRPLPDLGEHEGNGYLVHAIGGGRALAATRDRVFRFDGDWSVTHVVPEFWSVLSIAGAGPSDLWLTQRGPGRTPDTELLHFDGSQWAAVEAGDLGDYARVETDEEGGAWLELQSVVVRVEDGATTEPDRGLYADLWIGPDAVWSTTARQARRHSRPTAPSE